MIIILLSLTSIILGLVSMYFGSNCLNAGESIFSLALFLPLGAILVLLGIAGIVFDLATRFANYMRKQK